MKRAILMAFAAAMIFVAQGKWAVAGDLEAAYKKEFAFLEAEKRALETRLGDVDKESERRIAQARSEIEGLQRQLLALRGQADDLEVDLQEVERESSGDREQADLLEETMERAADTLRRFGYELAAPSEDPEVQATQIENLFKTASEAIVKGGEVRSEKGEFFLEDGSRASGEVTWIGRVAAFGVSEKASGALAPAGGGRLKIWPQPASSTAAAVSGGTNPSTMEIFLFEALEKSVEQKAEKTWLEVVKSGGVIAWVIVVLGFLAVLMIVARIFILLRAGSRTDRLLEQVVEHVGKGETERALEICKPRKGAAARVLAATIRNLKRDREHLEDIVSEAILHETPTVERFGTTVLVVAAVAPLLGLLGTVTGMISTFDVITEFGTGDPKMLSGGISEALVTTELGLIVAIPTLLIGTLLSGAANRILEEMERAALRLMNRADGLKESEAQEGKNAEEKRDGSKEGATRTMKAIPKGATA